MSYLFASTIVLPHRALRCSEFLAQDIYSELFSNTFQLNTLYQSHKNTYSDYINLNTSMTMKQPHPLGHEIKTGCVLAMAPVINQPLTTEAQVPTKVRGIFGGR